MASLGKRIFELQRQVAKRQRGKDILVSRPLYASPQRHCPACDKLVAVAELRTVKGTLVEAKCADCGADVKEAKS